MKRLMMFFTAFSMVMMLVACSEEEKMELEEVMNQAVEASNNLKSYSIEMDLTQNMQVNEQQMESDMKLTGDVTVDPMAMHQTITMDMSQMMNNIDNQQDQANIPQTLKMETYFSDEGFYVQNPMADGWMVMPKDMHEQILSMSSMEQKPGKELEKLQEYVEDVSFSEEEDFYVISFSASGDKVKELISDLMEQTMGNLPMNNMMDNMKINNLEYMYKIEKDSFYPREMKMNTDMEIKIEDQTMHMVQEAEGKYSNFNNVEPIVIPEEVKENAQEMPMNPQLQQNQ